MRRSATLLVLVGLVAGAAAAPARAKKPKAPRAQTYYLVPGADSECALSTDRNLADPTRSCGDDFDGATQPVLGTAPTAISTVDGGPLTIDVKRPVLGKVTVRSTSVIGHTGQIGAGRPQLAVRLTGSAAGKQVTVGEATTEAYTVTPLQEDYVVEFAIEPDTALAGVALDGLTLELDVTGPSAQHDGFPADGSSTLTIPLAR